MAIELSLSDFNFNASVKNQEVTLSVSHKYSNHRVFLTEPRHSHDLTRMKAVAMDMMAELLQEGFNR